MDSKSTNRSRIIGIRLTVEEFSKIDKCWKKSTCRKLSDYVRRLLFEKPVTTLYRNKSADDTLAEITKLRTELNHIGNNFNQAVKRLHTLDSVPEMKHWITVYELEKKTLFNKVEEIKNHSKKLAEKWLQS